MLRLALAALAVSGAAADTLYAIDGEQCGESDVPHAFIGFARAANAALQVGTCAEQGYSVDAGTTEVQSPLGPITTRLFTRGDAVAGGVVVQQQQPPMADSSTACGDSMVRSMSTACAGFATVTDTAICGTSCEVAAAATVASGCTLPDRQLDADVRTAVQTCADHYAIGPTGCTGQFTTITDMGVCETAKAAIEPTMGGVQAGGFGDEWADGCFFNRGTVYFHTTGDRDAHASADRYTANGGWGPEHQALCQLAPPYRLMPGCSHGYLPVTDLQECEAGKASIAADLAGVTRKGFGTEWANGCFVNAGTVYFHTRGDQSAHDDRGSYTANGGWSDTHQALCKRDPALQEGH